MESSLRLRLSADRWYVSCPPELQVALVKLSRLIQLRHGQALFEPDEKGSGLCCVVGGSLLVSNVNEEGKVHVLAQVEPCQWMGEISTLDSGPRAMGAYANGITEVLFVPGEALECWLNQHPQYWRHIGILACQKLRGALDSLQELSFLSLEQRILKRLERVATGYGSRVVPAKRVKVPQEVIAQMMGISRQSANKALKSLEEMGLISRSYGAVELPQKEPLPVHIPIEMPQMGCVVRRFKRVQGEPETVF